jgi:hypothetical protein
MISVSPSLWGVALEIVVSIRHDPVAIRPGFSFKKPSQTRLLNYLNAAGQYVLMVPNLSLMWPGFSPLHILALTLSAAGAAQP